MSVQMTTNSCGQHINITDKSEIPMDPLILDILTRPKSRHAVASSAHSLRPSQKRSYAWSVRKTRRMERNPPTSSCGQPGISKSVKRLSDDSGYRSPRKITVVTAIAHAIVKAMRFTMRDKTREPKSVSSSSTQSDLRPSRASSETGMPSSVVSSPMSVEDSYHCCVRSNVPVLAPDPWRPPTSGTLPSLAFPAEPELAVPWSCIRSPRMPALMSGCPCAPFACRCRFVVGGRIALLPRRPAETAGDIARG